MHKKCPVVAYVFVNFKKKREKEETTVFFPPFAMKYFA